VKSAVGLALLGVFALIVQGGVATFLPPPYCPDFAFLVVLGLGLLWDRPVAGLVLSGWLGYCADLLSGSLFGQHALLRLFVFSSARLASRRVNIRGLLPLACFAAGGTVLYGLALVAVSDFFTGSSGMRWSWLDDLARHAFANAVAAPLVLRAVAAVLDQLDEVSDPSRRTLRLDPRQRPV
jgi:cell shape-determining protein MreD